MNVMNEIILDLGTFTGLITVVSMVMTQVLKLVPAIDGSKLLKILTSVVVGMLIAIVSWALQISPLLEATVWWQALLYGVAAGLSGCGFYDVVKAVGGLFVKKDDDEDDGFDLGVA